MQGQKPSHGGKVPQCAHWGGWGVATPIKEASTEERRHSASIRTVFEGAYSLAAFRHPSSVLKHARCGRASSQLPPGGSLGDCRADAAKKSRPKKSGGKCHGLTKCHTEALFVAQCDTGKNQNKQAGKDVIPNVLRQKRCGDEVQSYQAVIDGLMDPVPFFSTQAIQRFFKLGGIQSSGKQKPNHAVSNPQKSNEDKAAIQHIQNNCLLFVKNYSQDNCLLL